MDGSRILFNGSKPASRLYLENVFLKLLLLLFINVLIKRNMSLEIHLLATAIFHWEFATGTLSPTPSYSLLSRVDNITPSLTSFQASISNDFSRTLNASITASKALNELTSQTASFQINMPVTKTKLAHLQGKIEFLFYGRSPHILFLFRFLRKQQTQPGIFNLSLCYTKHIRGCPFRLHNRSRKYLPKSESFFETGNSKKKNVVFQPGCGSMFENNKAKAICFKYTIMYFYCLTEKEKN